MRFACVCGVAWAGAGTGVDAERFAPGRRFLEPAGFFGRLSGMAASMQGTSRL